MRREMVLSGRLIGNYDVDNVKAIYENDQRGLTQPQSEYNSLIGTVGKALAEADAQLETQIGEFVQVARQDHAVDSEEEQIRLPLKHSCRTSTKRRRICSALGIDFRGLFIHILWRKGKLRVRLPKRGG
jgi:hypothetical protein